MVRPLHGWRVTMLLSTLLVLCFASAAQASFDSLPAESLVANGPVDAMAVSGETLYLGGSFSTIGPRTGLGVPFSSDLETRDKAAPQVSGLDGVIYASVSDGAGGWYVGGSFTSVGGHARSDLVHILANDTVDPSFKPEPDGAVRELALSGSTLYVGGQFDKIAGQSREGLAALETATGAANAFDPIFQGDPEYYGEYMCGLGVDGSYIFVCGGFGEVDGQKRAGLALLNTADGSLTSWNPENRDRPQLLYLSPTGVLYLGGFYGEFLIEPTKLNKFNEPKRIYHYGVGVLELAPDVTGQPTPLEFNPHYRTPGFFSEEPVTSFVQIGGTLYIGGRFVDLEEYGEEEDGNETYNETPYDRVMAVDPAKNYEILPFEAGPNNEVTALGAAAGHLYLAGTFSQVGGKPRQGVAAVNPVSAALEGGNPEIDGRVDALGVGESGVYAGGSITTVGGASRQGLAAIDTATGQLDSFDPVVEEGSVNALAASSSTLYVGGTFRFATGSGEESHGRYHLAAFSASSGALDPLNPEPNESVNALALSGQTLFVGGSFNKLGEVAHGGLAAFSTTTEALEEFNPQPNGSVDALTISSGKLYAAGSFSKLEGESGTPARSDVAGFELPSLSLDQGFVPPTIGGTVTAVAANASSVYAGGDFNDVGETYRPRLAALSAANGTLTEWEPEVSNDVDTLLLDGSTLYAGGIFGDAGGAERAYVAGLSTENGGATAFDPEPDNDVRAIAQGPSALYLGGNFDQVAGQNDSYVATFDQGSLAEEETHVVKEKTETESGTEGSSAGSSTLGAGGAGSESYAEEASSAFYTGPAESAGESAAAPVISDLKLPARIERLTVRTGKGRHKITTKPVAPAFTFTLSEPASVKISLTRIVSERCGRNKTCTRLLSAGTLTISAHAGANSAPFPKASSLAAGNYRASLVATQATLSSKALTTSFQLLGRG